MRSDSIRTVSFHARDEGSARLTWGQLNMWFPLREFGAESANYNLRRAVTHEAGITPDEALNCIRLLIEQHQALRTTVKCTADEDPQQHINAAGVYQVPMYDAAADYREVVETAMETAAALPFDLESEPPARFCCVCREGRVHAIVLVVSHVVADVAALRILVRRLGALMDGRPEVTPDPWWEPMDQAWFEQSAQGRDQERRALAHWSQALAAVPGAMFGTPRPVHGPAFHRVGIESPALAATAGRLAAQMRVSTSAVLLAATSLMLSSVSGADFTALKVIASNRHTPQLKNLVSCCAQDALFVMTDFAGEGFRGVVRKVLRGSTAAIFNAQYDPRAVKELLKQTETERGASLGLSLYFNDSRETALWPGFQETDPSGIEKLRGLTRFEYLGSHEHDDMSFHLHVRQSDTACRIELSADARFITPRESAAFLAGMEDSLSRAAADDADVTGFRPVPVDINLA